MSVRWLAVTAWLLIFAGATVTMADPDLWGHVRFGLDIAASHTIPSVDPYSFTQDRPWINHEWLSELQMGLAYRAIGATGLSLLKGLLLTATMLLVWRGWRGVDFGPRLVLLAGVAIGIARSALTMRPQIWSLLLFAILCRVLLSSRDRARWWLPVGFALWANLHGGWIVGLGVAAVWWGVQGLGDRAARAADAAVLLASVAATLLTPYGVALWEFMLSTVRLGRDVQEWQPLWTAPPGNWFAWAAAVATGAWSIRRLVERRAGTAAVFAMLAFGALKVERLLPFLVTAVALLAAPAFRRAWPARPLPAPGAAADRRVLAGFAIAATAAAVWIGTTSFSCIQVRGTWVPDAEAAGVLRTAPPGRLVTFFDWGEYAIWHVGPGVKVSMDGRRETIYSPAQLAVHAAVLAGEAGGFKALEEWRPEYIWLPLRASRTRAWLIGHGYTLIRETPSSFVAARVAWPEPATEGRPSARAGRCFPE